MSEMTSSFAPLSFGAYSLLSVAVPTRVWNAFVTLLISKQKRNYRQPNSSACVLEHNGKEKEKRMRVMKEQYNTTHHHYHTLPFSPFHSVPQWCKANLVKAIVVVVVVVHLTMMHHHGQIGKSQLTNLSRMWEWCAREKKRRPRNDACTSFCKLIYQTHTYTHTQRLGNLNKLIIIFILK